MNTDQIAAKLKHAGLHQRPSQLKMISEALMALNNKQIICLEAPTGTGKTISYGIASHLAKTDQQTVIISTATVALQEQLQNKDIPLLAKILNVPIRSGQAKGRRRYVCHARLFDDNLQMDIFSNDSYRQVLQSLLEKKLGWRSRYVGSPPLRSGMVTGQHRLNWLQRQAMRLL